MGKKTKSDERILAILEKLDELYPDAKCSLNYETAFQLLVATILSAQCTDERVNQVTPLLFERFPTPQQMARASLEELEEMIRSTNFYRNKARALQACSQVLVEKHEGQVPQTLEELIVLRGVGRKTANVVLGNAFQIPGMVVDTHIGRVSRRLGLTKKLDPVEVERDLMHLIPKDKWIEFGHQLIQHGRRICMARNPRCNRCGLNAICRKVGVKDHSGM